MTDNETEKIKCRDVSVGDWISPEANRTCNMLVREIEEGAKIMGVLPARRLHLGNEQETLVVSNYGPGKPMRRRAT